MQHVRRQPIAATRALTPHHRRLLDHCVKTTSASRKFMCENQGRIVPKDYALFPGKMGAGHTASARPHRRPPTDHSSVVACRVGSFPKAVGNAAAVRWRRGGVRAPQLSHSRAQAAPEADDGDMLDLGSLNL